MEKEQILTNRRRPPKEALCVYLRDADYQETLELQHAIVKAKYTGSLTQDVVLLVEHNHVFTLGKQGKRNHVIAPPEFLNKKGIPVLHIERGGDVTYHGPGQLVCYPIIDIRVRRYRVVDFIAALEEIMIGIASDWSIKAERNDLNHGVWIGMNKMGSVGISIRQGISFHGLALNINTSLEPFSWINPCGLEGISMTTFEKQLNKKIPMNDVFQSAGKQIEKIFDIELNVIELEGLEKLLFSD